MKIAVVDSDSRLLAFVADDGKAILREGLGLFIFGDNDPVFEDDGTDIRVSPNKFIVQDWKED